MNIVLNSQIEETKYVSIHQKTIESIYDSDANPLKNLYEEDQDNTYSCKAIDEKFKQFKYAKTDVKSLQQPIFEEESIEKVENKVDLKINNHNHIPHLPQGGIENQDGLFVFPKLESLRLK